MGSHQSPIFHSFFKSKSEHHLADRRVMAVNKAEGLLCLRDGKGVGGGSGEIQPALLNKLDGPAKHFILQA